MAQTQSAQAMNQREKNEDLDHKNEDSKLFIISLRLMGHALSNLVGHAVECGPHNQMFNYFV